VTARRVAADLGGTPGVDDLRWRARLFNLTASVGLTAPVEHGDPEAVREVITRHTGHGSGGGC
jgi:hypothetical protein